MSEHIHYDPTPAVSDAINTRRSLRAFLPTEIPRSTLEAMLTTAARAPSGTNMQPWQTYVLTGQSKTSLCEATCLAFDDVTAGGESEVRYYPERWFEPYLGRRREVGWALYSLLGIEKGDR